MKFLDKGHKNKKIMNKEKKIKKLAEYISEQLDIDKSGRLYWEQPIDIDAKYNDPDEWINFCFMIAEDIIEFLETLEKNNG